MPVLRELSGGAVASEDTQTPGAGAQAGPSLNCLQHTLLPGTTAVERGISMWTSFNTHHGLMVFHSREVFTYDLLFLSFFETGSHSITRAVLGFDKYTRLGLNCQRSTGSTGIKGVCHHTPL